MVDGLPPTGGPWRTVGGYPTFCATLDGVEVRFVGRGPEAPPKQVLAAIWDSPTSLSWLQQTHSVRVREAHAGCVGEGDALTTSKAGLVLAISTADCVPVVVACEKRIWAIHAGWRGLAGGIIGTAVRVRSAATAWIGPAIGPCCYEVGTEVAEAVVAAAADPSVAVAGRGARPYLDLVRAAELQLRAAGVESVVRVGGCTRCDDRLWSYRQSGVGAGRNLAFVWRRDSG